MPMPSNITLLILGGTSSFGDYVLRRFLNSDIAELRIFSWYEKQYKLRKHLKPPFGFGDMQDYISAPNAERNMNVIHHVTASKQVPSGRIYPLEADKTNLIGKENLIRTYSGKYGLVDILKSRFEITFRITSTPAELLLKECA
jgi:UDP-N-acetylglucosamine 4,6-dehydratase